MSPFWDFIDNGLQALGIKDEVDELADNFGRFFGTNVQQPIADLAGYSGFGEAGEVIGTGLGQLGEESQRWNPGAYFLDEQHWKPWELAPDAIGYLTQPWEYLSRNLSPVALGGATAAIQGKSVAPNQLGELWNTEAPKFLPFEGAFTKGLLEEAINPLNWIPAVGQAAKVPGIGRVLGPIGKVATKFDDLLAFPITGPLKAAGKGLEIAGVTKLSRSGQAAHDISLIGKALAETTGNKHALPELMSYIKGEIDDIPGVSQASKDTLRALRPEMEQAFSEVQRHQRPYNELVSYLQEAAPELADEVAGAPYLKDVSDMVLGKLDARADELLGRIVLHTADNQQITNYLVDPLGGMGDMLVKLIKDKYGIKPSPSWMKAVPDIVKQAWLGANPAYHLANALDDNTKLLLNGINPLNGTRNIDNLIQALGYTDIKFLGKEGLIGSANLPKGGLEALPGWGPIQKKFREFGEWREDLTRKTMFAHHFIGEYNKLQPKYINRLYQKLATVNPEIAAAVKADLSSKGWFSPGDIQGLIHKYTRQVIDGTLPSPSITPITFGGDHINAVRDLVQRMAQQGVIDPARLDSAVQQAERRIIREAEMAGKGIPGATLDELRAMMPNIRKATIDKAQKEGWEQLYAALRRADEVDLPDIQQSLLRAVDDTYRAGDRATTQYMVDHMDKDANLMYWVESVSDELTALGAARSAIGQLAAFREANGGVAKPLGRNPRIQAFISDMRLNARKVSMQVDELDRQHRLAKGAPKKLSDIEYAEKKLELYGKNAKDVERYIKSLTPPTVTTTAPLPSGPINPITGATGAPLPTTAPLSYGTTVSHITSALSGNETVVRGVDNPNLTYRVRWRVEELDRPIASHRLDGSPTPGYPLDLLQNRDRSGGISQYKVQKNARELSVESALHDAQVPTLGAPIVGPDNHVEVGNGRILSLRYAAQHVPDKYDNYKQQLIAIAPQYGLDPSEIAKMSHPVLLRERMDDLPTDELRKFVTNANAPEASALTVIERATTDMHRLTPSLFSYKEGESLLDALNHPRNKEFVNNFIQQIPSTEATAMRSGNTGLISREGLDRVRNAMLASAYGGKDAEPIMVAFLESADPVMKRLGDGLLAAAPAMTEAQSFITRGLVSGDINSGKNVSDAVNLILRSKEQGYDLSQFLNQMDMDTLAPVADRYPKEVTGLALDLDNARKRSQKAVQDVIEAYGNRIKQGGATLFDEIPITPAVAPATPAITPAPSAPMPAQTPAAAPPSSSITPLLPHDLQGAQPRYNIGASAYIPRFASDVDKALFIVSQATPSKADKRYMAWLRGIMPNYDDQQIRAAGAVVRQRIKEIAQEQGTPGPLAIPTINTGGGNPPQPKLLYILKDIDDLTGELSEQIKRREQEYLDQGVDVTRMYSPSLHSPREIEMFQRQGLLPAPDDLNRLRKRRDDLEQRLIEGQSNPDALLPDNFYNTRKVEQAFYLTDGNVIYGARHPDTYNGQALIEDETGAFITVSPANIISTRKVAIGPEGYHVKLPSATDMSHRATATRQRYGTTVREAVKLGQISSRTAEYVDEFLKRNPNINERLTLRVFGDVEHTLADESPQTIAKTLKSYSLGYDPNDPGLLDKLKEFTIGGAAYNGYAGAVINLYQGADEYTALHELYHYVHQSMLGHSDRQQVLKVFRNLAAQTGDAPQYDVTEWFARVGENYFRLKSRGLATPIEGGLAPIYKILDAINMVWETIKRALHLQVAVPVDVDIESALGSVRGMKVASEDIRQMLTREERLDMQRILINPWQQKAEALYPPGRTPFPGTEGFRRLQLYDDEYARARAPITQERANRMGQADEAIIALRQWADGVRSGQTLSPRIIQSMESARDIRNILNETSTEWADIIRNTVDGSQDYTNKYLFNYGEATRLDEVLRTVSPFTVWQTRNVPAYLTIMAENPQLFRMLSLYSQESERQQSDLNLTQRFNAMLPIPGLNRQWWFDPSQAMSITTQAKEPFVLTGENGEGATSFGETLATAQKLSGGMSLWPWIQYPLQLTGQFGQMPYNSLLPVSRLIEGVTGLNPERPIQKGLSELQSKITGTPAPLTESIFLDDAINRRLAEKVAQQEMTVAQAQRAQDNPQDPLWAQAEQEVRREWERASLIRFFEPFTVKYVTQGEIAIRQNKAELKQLFGDVTYKQMTPDQQKAYIQYIDEHPALQAERTRFMSIPERELYIQEQEYYGVGSDATQQMAKTYGLMDTAQRAEWRKAHPAEYSVLKTHWSARDDYLKSHTDLKRYFNWKDKQDGNGTLRDYVRIIEQYERTPEYRQWRNKQAQAEQEAQQTTAKPAAPVDPRKAEINQIWQRYAQLKEYDQRLASTWLRNQGMPRLQQLGWKPSGA